MLSLLGPDAFSAARLAKVMRAPGICEANPRVKKLHAQYLHLVDLEQELSPDERRKLEALLAYGPNSEPDQGEETLEVGGRFVVPRFGTISPWSSKATEIARACGLSAVRRIERGVAWTLGGVVANEGA